MRTTLLQSVIVAAIVMSTMIAKAQVNSGSNGHDGALNPTANLVIDMADHPDGIYHYTSVNIPAGVTVSFIPNAANKPVVWLVKGDCVIGGTVDVSGARGPSGSGGTSGPGGWGGGQSGDYPAAGSGPGGGTPGTDAPWVGGNASYATLGLLSGSASGSVYGNQFLLPLLGGSGGGGNHALATYGGGGGGGAIMVASSGQISVTGQISSYGGHGGVEIGWQNTTPAGAGSGGAIRLVASKIVGNGHLNADGGQSIQWGNNKKAGDGRVRIDSMMNQFGGEITGVFTQGYQPIIIPAAGQSIQLGITSVAGIAVPASPTGTQAKPDITIPGQQSNPIPIVVRCTNVPLNTEITVVVQPVNGAPVQAVALNKTGTLASSTATASVNMPRGGGIIYAKAVTGITATASGTSAKDSNVKNIAQTGWTADGETFAKVEVTATLGGPTQLAYLTESGKRYTLPTR